MRKVLAVGAALVLLLSACSDDPKPPGESTVDVGTPELVQQKADAGIATCIAGDGSSDLPDLTLPCLGGGPSVDLASLTGPLVINLWASNCGPCKKELPALQAFHERYGDRVPLLGIDVVDTLPGAAIHLADTSGVTYPQLADPGGDLYSQDDVRIAPSLPAFLLVRPDGSVTVRNGGLTSVGEVKALVESQLGVTL